MYNKDISNKSQLMDVKAVAEEYPFAFFPLWVISILYILLNLWNKVFYLAIIEILTSLIGVTKNSYYLKLVTTPSSNGNERNIKSATTQIKDDNVQLATFLIV